MMRWRNFRDYTNHMFFGTIKTRQLKKSAAVPEILTSEIIRKNGYAFEAHKVISEDGYITCLYRIPHGPDGRYSSRGPVFLYPGLLARAETWTCIGPSHALGYLLADEGYDVWMANPRGSTLSEGHAKLNSKSRHDRRKYWNFSIHEMGYYDVAASVDYILRITNWNKLKYIGHSQGCCNLVVLLTERTEYNEKFDKFIALAPAVKISNSRSVILKFARLMERSKMITKFFMLVGGFNAWPFHSSPMTEFICAKNSPFKFLILFPARLLAGYNPRSYNKAQLLDIFKYYPTGSSFKQVVHFFQHLSNSDFKQFDYGPKINLCKYCDLNPPVYNLSNLKVPTHIYYGLNDLAVDSTGVVEFSEQISNLASLNLVSDPKFTHNDFVFSPTARELVYTNLIDKLNAP